MGYAVSELEVNEAFALMQTAEVVDKQEQEERSRKRELLGRDRWDGILTPDEISFCHANEIEIGYDCVQLGWVVYAEEEDNPAQRHDSGRDKVSADDQRILALNTAFSKDLHNRLLAQRQNSEGELCFGDLHSLVREHVEHLETSSAVRVWDKCHNLMLSTIAKVAKGALAPSSPSGKVFTYRKWTHDDVADYCKILGNPTIWTFLPEDYPSDFSEDLAKDLIDVANLSKDNLIQAIVYEGKVIGQIRLLFNNDYPEVRSAEVAYILAEEYWGKGLMRKILGEFTRYSFAKHNLDFIYAWIRPDHPASIKSAQKVGYIRDNFTREKETAELAQRPGFERYICYG